MSGTDLFTSSLLRHCKILATLFFASDSKNESKREIWYGKSVTTLQCKVSLIKTLRVMGLLNFEIVFQLCSFFQCSKCVGIATRKNPFKISIALMSSN